MAKKPKGIEPENDDLTARALKLIEADTRREVRDEFKARIAALEEAVSTAEKKAAATEASRQSEARLFERINLQKSAQNDELKELIAKLTADNSAIQVKMDSEKMDHEIAMSVQKGVIRDFEVKLAEVVGRFTQLEKHAKGLAEASKQIPLPLVVNKPVPSFEFTQTRDKNGNMKVIATPIGG
jgi:hypothetical protein